MRRYIWWAVGAAVALLLALAWLQYHWLGQLSNAERERMQRNVESALANLTLDFNIEIARIHGALQAGRFALRDIPARQEYAERFLSWANDDPNADLLGAFYITGGENGVETIEKLDVSTGTFVPVAWPEHLAGIRRELAGRSFVGAALGPPWPIVMRARSPVLIAPDARRMRLLHRRRFPGPGREPGPPVEPGNLGRDRPGWTILELNGEKLREQYLPALVRKHFAREGRLEYRVQVVARSEPPEIIFDSKGNASLLDRPDAETGMMLRRPEAVRRVFSGGLAQDVPLPGPERGLWRVLVQHEAGSLDNVVSAVRRRNLTIGFAVLLFLSASVIALIIAWGRAHQLAEMQLEFVAGVSHELRTPLSVIRSAGENLADGVAQTEPQIRRYGELVRDEGRRLSGMVEQILGFARSYSAGNIERHPVPVAELLDGAEQAAASDLAETGSAVVREVSPDAVIEGDATALTYCLRNLISNAARHSEPGAEITVSASRSGPNVELAVSDRGPGIDPKDLPHLFEPFYRGARARSEQRRGLGLGLALVKRVAEGHRGSVRVENRLGGGARFVLRLPAAKDGL